MASALDNQQAVTLDELPAAQRALLIALGEGRNGPTRARDLADTAHVTRRGAGQRMEALEHHGLVFHSDGTGPTLADHVRVYELTDLGQRVLAARGPEPAPPNAGVVHQTVMRQRTRPSYERAQTEIARALGRADEHLHAWFAAELERVYAAGVGDGFVQGVAAEAASQTEEGARAA